MIAFCPFSCNLSSNINILESQIFVMKPKRTDSTRPKIFQSPAAAAAAASVTAAYALAKSEKLEFIETDDSNFEGLRENNPVQDFSIEINAIREENKVLESSVAEVKAENSRVREKIDDINGTYAELSKVLSISQMTCIAHCKSSNGKKKFTIPYLFPSGTPFGPRSTGSRKIKMLKTGGFSLSSCFFQ